MLRKSFFFGFLSVFLFISAQADDRRTDQTKLVVMTFNTKFMWDGVAPEEGSVQFAWKNNQALAEEHMRKIAQVIIDSNPDVINLVEVENLNAVNTLNTKFLAGRGYKAYLVDGRDNSTGQDVGLLTRIDPDGNQTRYDGRTGRSGTVAKTVSKNYVARLTFGQFKISLVGLHLLAQPSNVERKLQRQAQADAIRLMAIDERAAGYSVIVLGDFNDFDGDTLYSDHLSNMPITNVLESIRLLDRTVSADDLTNASKFVTKSNRYTAFWDRNNNNTINAPGEYSSIDHILLSSDLVSRVESVQMPHELDPLEVSDHFPVVVKLRTTGTPSPIDTLMPDTNNAGIRITALLPNPSGTETQEEAATIKNNGAQAISMVGWKLRDSSGRTWSLDSLGTIRSNQQKMLKRRGQSMTLKNSGDTIQLLDSSGTIVHTLTYGTVAENEVVSP